MKIIKSWLSLAVICSSLGVSAQNRQGFVLKGKIDGLPDGSVVLLKKQKDTLATGISFGDKFELKGFIEGGANYYFLALDTSIAKKVSEALWLENQPMVIEGSLTKWPSLSLEGSQSHREYKEVLSLYETTSKNGNEKEAIKKFINEHLNSLYISDIIIKVAHFYRKGELDSLYSMLSPAAKNSHYGKMLSGKIARDYTIAQTMETMAKTKSIPNLKVTDLRGTPQNLYDLTRGAKYTLIDFWASWCSPCRASVPGLKDIYQKYKPYGFNIIGISIDKDENKWKKAVIEDKAPWDQCVDNIQSLTKDHLGFDAIPAYILIDSTGKVIRADYVQTSNSVQIINKGRLSLPELKLLLNELFAVNLH